MTVSVGKSLHSCLLRLVALLKHSALSWSSYCVQARFGRSGLFLRGARDSHHSPLIRQQLILDSGKSATIRSRLIPLTEAWNITVWEWDEPASVMEHYWSAKARGNNNAGRVLDPFGLVSWPGAVVAAQEMMKLSPVENATVLVLGAGPGVEAQAAAMLWQPTRVVATDIHPTTLQLLHFGAQQAGLDDIITEQVFDVCSADDPLPECDVMIVADVLYNDQLASHVARRCLEAFQRGTKVLVSDSQRLSDIFPELNKHLEVPVAWEERHLRDFTGSGVMINEDQTYNVTARVLALGW